MLKLKQIQDPTTNIKVGDYRFPDGTFFIGFVNFTIPNSTKINSNILWYVNGQGDDVELNGLPNLVKDINVVDADGNLIYKFAPDFIPNDPFNTALTNILLIIRDFLRITNVNLYNCEIINIP